MPSRNEEDYLRCIYELQSKAGGSVRQAQIATALGVSKPSVSEMMLKLDRAGLAFRRAYGAVSLTQRGVEEARKVLRRHRLLEVFLARLLGLKKSFHKEAHEIEHSFSEAAESGLDRLLKHPKKCPDGDEIPPRESRVLSLERAPLHKPLVVLFSRLESKEELSRIRALGIIHGERVRVLKRVAGGPLTLKVKGSEIALGHGISSQIFVEAEK
ncbi:MAG: metal-dependent transcriptional regulator [Candidatus Micrarchaeia archaeon]|jgi:DtxR family Mn-dependent transcriptional regulator